MKKVKISFSMVMDESQKTDFVVPGKIVSRNLIFSDPEGNVYRIHITPPRLAIAKSGNVVTKIDLLESTSTQGMVTASGMNFSVTVQTTRLEFAEDAVEAIYDLLDGNTVLSHHALNLHWTSDDE